MGPAAAGYHSKTQEKNEGRGCKASGRGLQRLSQAPEAWLARKSKGSMDGGSKRRANGD